MSQHDLERPAVHYPESDGKPMAETDLHRDILVDLIVSARHHFRARPDVYVSGNLLLYYEEGNPRKSISPDVFVVRGIANHRRPIFKLWAEARGPELVVEVVSPSTRRRDLGVKRSLYESIGVTEYFLLDPVGDRIDPPLGGYRRRDDRLEPIEAELRPDGTRVLSSAITGLELHLRGEWARWVDPATAEPLRVPDDLFEAVEEERQRADALRARADSERARADSERARADSERERADSERERAKLAQSQLEAIRTQAAAEKQRADAMAAEHERLRAEILRLRAAEDVQRSGQGAPPPPESP